VRDASQIKMSMFASGIMPKKVQALDFPFLEAMKNMMIATMPIASSRGRRLRSAAAGAGDEFIRGFSA